MPPFKTPFANALSVKSDVKLPAFSGVPVIAPVEEFNDNPAGKIARQSEIEPVAVGVALKATPTLPVKVWPEVITG